jgi:hypothetical protein
VLAVPGREGIVARSDGVLAADLAVAALGDSLATTFVTKDLRSPLVRVALAIKMSTGPLGARLLHVPAALGVGRDDPRVRLFLAHASTIARCLGGLACFVRTVGIHQMIDTHDLPAQNDGRVKCGAQCSIERVAAPLVTNPQDLPGRSLRIIGKGHRERQVFLTNDWCRNKASPRIERHPDGSPMITGGEPISSFLK